MRPPAWLGPAAPDDDGLVAVMAHHHGADRGIGPGVAEPAPAEGERQRHEAGVVTGHQSHDPYFRAGTIAGASSSPDSSPSTRSKSLASRKLR